VPGCRGEALVAAVREAELPTGAVHAFVHGEAGCIRDLRRFLRAELLVPPEQLSASGYWRVGRTDERWRAEKAEWNAAVEADEQAAPAA
jgi:NADPH-dependent ferric siderophore reductase